MASKPFQIVALIFPGFNVLDLTGPSEVLGNAFMPEPKPRILVASATENTRSAEGITVKRDISFIELLAQQTDGSSELARFDMLLVPGGPPNNVQDAIDENHNLLSVISTFSTFAGNSLYMHEKLRQRWLFSICTGAGFLGHQGILAGKTATTHWDYIDTLKAICRDASIRKTTVVRKRWIDAGQTDSGVRIITAGGVSCGIDASLWITGELFGMQQALDIANGMDYSWNVGNQKVTEGHLVYVTEV